MSLIEKLRNKPKAKQKERIRVGIRGAPKEKVQIKTKIVNKLDEGISYLEKAYELDPIPQGQSTSDRRICALLTGYYIADNLEKCSEMINKIVDVDFKSWLLSYDIFEKNNSFNKNEDWFKKGLTKFENIDVKLEVDRFHLNDKDLKNELIEKANKILAT